MADNEVKIPTVEEIAELPRRAQVAFAARCARRVQPLFVDAWPDAPQEHIGAVDRAIALAEASAVSPAPASDLKNASAASDAAFAASDAAFAASAFAAASASDASASDAAASASDAAASASDAAFASASDAAFASASAASDAAFAADAIRSDFDLLRALGQREGWNDDTPVPPEVFGPVWLEGEPEGWPEEGKEERAGDAVLEIDLELPEDLSQEELEEIVLELVDSVDDMHRAEGGRGVVIDAVEIPLRVHTPQGVC